MIKWSLDRPRHYQLAATLTVLQMGPYDPCLRVEDSQAWWAMRTPEGPVTLHVVDDQQRLAVEGWGEGADWAAEQLTGLLGLDDRPETYQPQDRMRQLVRRFPGMHFSRLPLIFDRLVQIILMQLVASTDAFSGWARCTRLMSELAPGPNAELWLPPTDQAWRETPEYDLVSCGVIPKLSRTIRRVAKRRKLVEAKAAEGPEAIAETLHAFPGIGPWTIQYLLGSGLGEPDALLTGDYNMPHTVAWFLAGEERASDERMVELLVPHIGHRFRVIRLLWQSGLRAPRRSPKAKSLRNRFGLDRWR